MTQGQAVFVPAGAAHQFTGYEGLSVLVVFARRLGKPTPRSGPSSVLSRTAAALSLTPTALCSRCGCGTEYSAQEHPSAIMCPTARARPAAEPPHRAVGAGSVRLRGPQTRSTLPPRHSRSHETNCGCSTPTGARRTTCRSARSTCSTTRCCASRCRPSTSSRACSGHCGTTPGLNLVYAHLNRVIRARDLNAIYITGPGHGGPALVANAYLEGTYSELYPNIAQRRGRAQAALPPVLVPRRHPEPRRARDARLDPRGRRARLLARRTPTARPSTTRTCSSPASSATARPRPARSRRAGTRTSS